MDNIQPPQNPQSGADDQNNQMGQPTNQGADANQSGQPTAQPSNDIGAASGANPPDQGAASQPGTQGTEQGQVEDVLEGAEGQGQAAGGQPPQPFDNQMGGAPPSDPYGGGAPAPDMSGGANPAGGAPSPDMSGMPQDQPLTPDMAEGNATPQSQPDFSGGPGGPGMGPDQGPMTGGQPPMPGLSGNADNSGRMRRKPTAPDQGSGGAKPSSTKSGFPQKPIPRARPKPGPGSETVLGSLPFGGSFWILCPRRAGGRAG